MSLQTLSLMRQFRLLPRKLGEFDRWRISEDEALVFSFPSFSPFHWYDTEGRGQ